MRPTAFAISVWLLSVALTTGTQWGCTSERMSNDATPTGLAQSTNDCPPAATLPNKTGWELGAANYTAQQEGEIVTVTATGENSTAGFKVQFAREAVKSFPPRLALQRKPPDGIVAQVITPFTVCVTFKSRQPIPAVTVRDSKGEHRVKVESSR